MKLIFLPLLLVNLCFCTVMATVGNTEVACFDAFAAGACFGAALYTRW